MNWGEKISNWSQTTLAFVAWNIVCDSLPPPHWLIRHLQLSSPSAGYTPLHLGQGQARMMVKGLGAVVYLSDITLSKFLTNTPEGFPLASSSRRSRGNGPRPTAPRPSASLWRLAINSGSIAPRWGGIRTLAPMARMLENKHATALAVL